LRSRPCGCLEVGADLIRDVFMATNSYLERNGTAKRDWLASMFHCEIDNKYGKERLCRECFCAFHGVHKSMASRIMIQVREGRVSFGNGLKGSGKHRGHPSVSDAIVAYLGEYAVRNGDYMPDKQEIHLPDYKWRHVWRKLCKRFAAAGQHEPSEGGFNKIRRELMNHVQIRKHKRFTKCEECLKLDKAIGDATGVKREFFVVLKNEHIEWQFRERAKYAKHKEEAIDPGTKHKYYIAFCIQTLA
jgi:hypothetical protein